METIGIIQLAYWNIRAVMENAKGCIGSNNELWGYLNELYEDIDRMENVLNIANRMDMPNV